jgi:membrane associated rhomboid family serine protease
MMRFHSFQRSDNTSPFIPSPQSFVTRLIVINIVVFILIHIVTKVPWLALFALVPHYVFAKGMIWQLLTYMFLHLSLWHLVLNMLLLWFFGSVLEQSWGKKQFILFYFFTGVGAALCSFIVAPGATSPVVGASGVIFGVLCAYAMMFPDNIILLFFIFPMKMKHAVFVLAGISLLGLISSPYSGISYVAQLGGGLCAYFYLKSESIRFRLSRVSPANCRVLWRRWIRERE